MLLLLTIAIAKNQFCTVPKRRRRYGWNSHGKSVGTLSASRVVNNFSSSERTPITSVIILFVTLTRGEQHAFRSTKTQTRVQATRACQYVAIVRREFRYDQVFSGSNLPKIRPAMNRQVFSVSFLMAFNGW